MADDDFKPFDINQLHRRAATASARERAGATEREMSVMEMQKGGRERRPNKPDTAPLVEGRDGELPVYTLFGQPIRQGQVLEVYTNRANGFLRGEVVAMPFPERPRLRVTLWNAWGRRDADGLPPKLGAWELPLIDGVMCRFSAALPKET